jgi:hypothetical protein
MGGCSNESLLGGLDFECESRRTDLFRTSGLRVDLSFLLEIMLSSLGTFWNGGRGSGNGRSAPVNSQPMLSNTTIAKARRHKLDAKLRLVANSWAVSNARVSQVTLPDPRELPSSHHHIPSKLVLPTFSAPGTRLSSGVLPGAFRKW